jgi:hypothetical protein
MHRFTEHLELWLTAAGLVVILLLTPLLFPGGAGWTATALVATVVGALHGVIFWLVRRRERVRRRVLLAQVRGMLKDRVNNQLQTILGHVSSIPDPDVATLRDIEMAVREIADIVGSLSEETLEDWHARYPLPTQ